MVFAYALIKSVRMRVVKVEANELISIRKNVECLWTDVSASFPKFILLQGVTQLLLYTVLGKIFEKVFKKCVGLKEKLRLLNTIGVSWKVSDMAVKDVEKFIQTVCYSGKKEESLTEIRVRSYKQIKTKTSQSLPPDEKSMLQAIKCNLYYLYYWSRV